MFKSLRSDGVGSTSAHTEGISKEEEDTLWQSGVLNVESSIGLLHAVFFYCGKCFCLRGGQEHRNLSLSQLERLYHPDRYIYRENSSKNKQGGLKQLRTEHKVVTIVANEVAGDRCPVFLLDRYISKLPTAAKEKDLFYCRALPTLPKKPEDPWYMSVAVGKNTLCGMVKEMFAKAGLSGKKTNHSLRVAGATSLFAAGVPERVIQGRTGHVSIEALRKYERVTENQELAVSKILTGEKDMFEKLPSTESNSNATPIVPPSEIEKKPVADSVPPPSGAQYNNCTINVYSAPPNFGALPGPSHFQPPLPSHVPAMSTLPASYSWLNYSDFDYYNQTHFQYQ